MLTSKKEGIETRSKLLGVKYPLAIAVALIAWFNAPAPIECISAHLSDFKIFLCKY